MSSRRSCLARFGTKVQRDAEFLDIVIVECAAELASPPFVDERWDAAQHVPGALRHGVFYPDDLGAHGGQEARRTGAGQLPGEVADADVAQGPPGIRSSMRPRRHSGRCSKP